LTSTVKHISFFFQQLIGPRRRGKTTKSTEHTEGKESLVAGRIITA